MVGINVINCGFMPIAMTKKSIIHGYTHAKETSENLTKYFRENFWFNVLLQMKLLNNEPTTIAIASVSKASRIM